MPMPTEIILLRTVHILGGAFWLGAALVGSVFLGPALGRAPESARPILEELRRRGLATAVPAAATLTVLSGARLLWIDSAGFQRAWLTSPTGLVFTAGGVAALAAYVAGGIANADAARPRPRLQRVAVACLLVSTVCMAVARYA